MILSSLLLPLLLAAAPPPDADAPPPAPAPVARKPDAPQVEKLPVLGVLGRKVMTSNGTEIGRLVDVLVDGQGAARAAVIDFGGFMGVGNRRVAVPWSDLDFTAITADADVKLDMTSEQIGRAPDYQGQAPVPVIEPKPAAAPNQPPPTPVETPGK